MIGFIDGIQDNKRDRGNKIEVTHIGVVSPQHGGQERKTHREIICLSTEHGEHGASGDALVSDADYDQHEEEESKLGNKNSQQEGNVDLWKVQGGKRDENQRRHGIFSNEDVETLGLWRSNHLERSRHPAQGNGQEDLGDGGNKITQVNVFCWASILSNIFLG